MSFYLFNRKDEKSSSARGLGRELAVALLVKIVLVVVIKFAFFSHPLDKADVAAKAAERIAGTGHVTAPSRIQRHPHDLEKP